MKYDLVSVGETMVCFLPDSVNPLRYVNGFRKTIAGAESNVCIGLSKLNKEDLLDQQSWKGRIRFLYKKPDPKRRRRCIG